MTGSEHLCSSRSCGVFPACTPLYLPNVFQEGTNWEPAIESSAPMAHKCTRRATVVQTATKTRCWLWQKGDRTCNASQLTELHKPFREPVLTPLHCYNGHLSVVHLGQRWQQEAMFCLETLAFMWILLWRVPLPCTWLETTYTLSWQMYSLITMASLNRVMLPATDYSGIDWGTSQSVHSVFIISYY